MGAFVILSKTTFNLIDKKDGQSSIIIILSDIL